MGRLADLSSWKQQETPVLTAAQDRWWRRFKRCLADMPSGIEIHIHANHVGIGAEGSRQAAVEHFGDMDNMIDIDSHVAKRIYACGETL